MVVHVFPLQMSFLFSFLGKRKKQLALEKEIDTQLKTKCEPCKDVLADYLMYMRKQNRLQCEAVDNAPLAGIPFIDDGVDTKYTVIEKNLEYNDKHLQELNQALSADSDLIPEPKPYICQYLRECVK